MNAYHCFEVVPGGSQLIVESWILSRLIIHRKDVCYVWTVGGRGERYSTGDPYTLTHTHTHADRIRRLFASYLLTYITYVAAAKLTTWQAQQGRSKE